MKPEIRFRIISVIFGIIFFGFSILSALLIFLPIFGYTDGNSGLLQIGYTLVSVYRFSAFLIPAIFLYAAAILFIPGWSMQSKALLTGMPFYFLTSVCGEHLINFALPLIKNAVISNFAYSALIICTILLILVEIFLTLITAEKMEAKRYEELDDQAEDIIADEYGANYTQQVYNPIIKDKNIAEKLPNSSTKTNTLLDSLVVIEAPYKNFEEKKTERQNTYYNDSFKEIFTHAKFSEEPKKDSFIYKDGTDISSNFLPIRHTKPAEDKISDHQRILTDTYPYEKLNKGIYKDLNILDRFKTKFDNTPLSTSFSTETVQKENGQIQQAQIVKQEEQETHSELNSQAAQTQTEREQVSTPFSTETAQKENVQIQQAQIAKQEEQETHSELNSQAAQTQTEREQVSPPFSTETVQKENGQIQQAQIAKQEEQETHSELNNQAAQTQTESGQASTPFSTESVQKDNAQIQQAQIVKQEEQETHSELNSQAAQTQTEREQVSPPFDAETVQKENVQIQQAQIVKQEEQNRLNPSPIQTQTEREQVSLPFSTETAQKENAQIQQAQIAKQEEQNRLNPSPIQTQTENGQFSPPFDAETVQKENAQIQQAQIVKQEEQNRLNPSPIQTQTEREQVSTPFSTGSVQKENGQIQQAQIVKPEEPYKVNSQLSRTVNADSVPQNDYNGDTDSDEEFQDDEDIDDEMEITAAQPLSKKEESPVSGYHVPYDLLNEYPGNEYWIIENSTRRAAAILKNTLREFKIDVEITGIRKGPVVTMFEVLPPHGIKLTKITALQDNIALRLAAESVRIVAPIPGKQAVGIEIPNETRSVVGFRELIESDLPDIKKMAIPIVLGKDITGEPQMLDLAQTPHLLIAGATGAGKSVCVNSIILSILYNRRPDEVKLLLVDPKIVELKLYNDIGHLLAPVITEPKKAFQALQYCLCEMERRYAMLDNLSVRDIKTYNKKIRSEKLTAEKLPYIVIIIDEFADLMATTGKDLEAIVSRLCAMSRAVGIHVVLATQRPSTDVITGLIKANIPSRIAFMVASRIDSRIILDDGGAEKLLGKGDMLYVGTTKPYPSRIQGTFVSEEEVERVVNYVKTLWEPEYIDDEIFIDDDDYFQISLSDEESDPLYNEALDIVLLEGKASASYIQRKLKIGYNRAARIIEEMEIKGVVGPANGSKPREVIHRH